jgi:hypothetical protein
MSVASATISGATFCLTVTAIFFVFAHFSGSSYNEHKQHYTLLSLCTGVAFMQIATYNKNV